MLRNLLTKSSARRLRSGLVSLLFIASQAGSALAPFINPSTVGATSNNGTLKVHEKGTPSNSESNDPKVCVFNFEAFDLDPNQTGNITIETQSGTPVITPVIVGLATDSGGDGETEYINDVGSLINIPDGHYKATLDNKFGTDPGDKAKSKVFKVDCIDDGNLEVNKKVDANGDGTFEGGNSVANNLGFKWGLDSEVPGRNMGSTAEEIPTGTHQVNENTITGYEFIGWYNTNNPVKSCENLDNDKLKLPVEVVVQTDKTRKITLCNAKVKEPKGSIAIIKDAVPNHERDFVFTTTGSSLSGFSLDDDADPTLSNTKTFSNLAAGSYSVKEGYVEGWELTGINCGQASGVTISGGTTTFNLAAGQNVTCTYTNTHQKGSIQVLKYVDEGEGYAQVGASSVFKWGLDGGPVNRDMGTTQSNVIVGNRSVTENSVTGYELAGWYIGQGSCTNQQNNKTLPVTANVQPNQTTTVTFCNKAKEEIKITLCHATEADLNNPFVSISISPAGAFNGHLGTGHQNGEDIIPPFQFNNQTYSQNWDSTGQAIYRNGCKKPSNSKISGYKFHDLNGNGQKDGILEPKIGGWTIYLYKVGNPNPIASTTTSNSLAYYGNYSFNKLPAGNYVVCEAHPAGWLQIIPDPSDLNENGCYDVTLNGIDTKSGVVFGNQARATIKVYKNVDKNGDGKIKGDHEENNHYWTWDYHSLLDSGNNLTTGGSAQSVRTGVFGSFYLINEDQKDGYDLIDVDCNQRFWRIGDSVKVFATVGDKIECTFTNKKRAEVIIEKKADPEDGTDFHFMLSKENPNEEDYDYDLLPTFNRVNHHWHNHDKHFILDDVDEDDGDNYTNKESLSLKTGKTYYITEASLEGWDLDKIRCNDGTEWYRDGNTLVLTLNDADDVRCWFKNEKRGEVVVTKFNDYDQDGYQDEDEPVLSGWDMTLETEKCSYEEDVFLTRVQNDYNECDYEYSKTQTTGDVGTEGVTTFTGVKPGEEHTLSETLKDDWHWSNTYCEYDDVYDPRGYPAGDNKYDLYVSPGETLECFVGNYQDPALNIAKSNNRPNTTTTGDVVTYTLVVSVPQDRGVVYDTKVQDLPPENFEYLPGSWTASSTVPGHNVSADIASAPGGQPTYASPGQWLLGTMLPGEVITLTYQTRILSNVTSGIYPDIAFAAGISATDARVLSNVSTGSNTPFVGTQVSVDVPVTVLVNTGAKDVWINTLIGASLLLAAVATLVRRQKKGELV